MKWLKATLIRATRTMAQTALGMITIGYTIQEIQWRSVLSVAVVAGIYSVVTCIATRLPELEHEKDIFK